MSGTGVPDQLRPGRTAKIVVLSVTEGEDKPLKYPGIFRKSELMILNKTDLLPYVPSTCRPLATMRAEPAHRRRPERGLAELEDSIPDGCCAHCRERPAG